MKLKDKVAIVTGAARGIGRAIALALAAEKATVMCVDVSAPEKSEALVNEIKSMGAAAEAYQADVRDYEAIEKMAQHVIEKYGRIDILVNNAGVNRDSLILMMTPEQWREVIEINLYGAFHCTKAVAQQMMFQKIRPHHKYFLHRRLEPRPRPRKLCRLQRGRERLHARCRSGAGA